MALTLKHQTSAQFMTRLRERFRNASREERARLAAWLYNRYEAGDITQTQIRAAFSLDTTEKWTTFRNRVQALRNSWLAVQAVEDA